MPMIMSQDNNTTFMKSCSEGELINDSDKMNVKQTQIEGSRLKRTFTLPRNPFGTNRTSKHRPKQKDGDTKSIINVAIEQNVVENEKCGKKVFRRPSWKKFITKIAHHMNSVGVTAGKQQLRDGTINYGERVPPLGGYAWPTDCTPGATGLRNHGNTCFMNAVLQCLSHTDIIAEYFVLDQYKVDLSRRNKLNSKKFGTRGEVTEQLALILKALWACQYYPELSTGFKAVVERHGSQYRGSSQHDAQEFLLWLLDKVHEDLNTATKKKYKTIKNSVGRPDEVVAAETLANHVRCNSSFVQAVFQAQFRSSLACPRCHRQSNTFDPFHCISVQLPHLADHPLLVTVVYVNQQPRCVRLGVRVSASSAVRELRALLTNDTGIPTEDIVLVEVTDTGFARTLSDCQSVWSGSEGENPNSSALYCVEAPRLAPALPTEPPAPYILLLWLNVLVEEDIVTRFGSPYVMQVSRETDYADLQKLMLKEMSVMVGAGVLSSRQEPGEVRLRILDPAADIADPHHYLQPELEHPLFTETVEQALALCGENAGPAHLKILLEWERTSRDKLLVDWNENCEQHSSVAEVMQNNGTAARLSLADCLAHYTRAETLAMEDAWRCPQCQQYLPVVKTLGLWSLPDILVIHLKRFRQQQMKGRNSTKLTTMVDFPLSGLDMSPHLAIKESQQGIPASPLLLGGAAWSPWKRPRKISSTFNDNSYDLYAVCYHHGNDLETGHYTAACKNPYDQRWYRFDDTRVTQIPTDLVTTELINDSAYILFYQRRHGSFVGCSSNSSSAASTSSVGSNCDHWAARMPKFTYQPKKDTIEKSTVPVKTADVAKSSDKIDTESKKDETEINDIAEPVNLRTSSSSLQDNHSNCKEQLSASPTDEKNLRNSISLSDNLRISMSDVAPPVASQARLDLLETDKLINKNSLYTMGESRRNTLSEYKNINDEFGNENEAVHRNSISLTVNPYLHHKDIHVNPKMNFFKDMDDNKVDESRTASTVESADESQMARICLTGDRGRRESDCEWIGTERGYSTLRVRNCLVDLNSQKEHHSDDEAPPARHDWVSPSSLRRPVVFTSANE